MTTTVQHRPWTFRGGTQGARQVCAESGDAWPCVTAKLDWAVSGALWRDLDTHAVRTQHYPRQDEDYPELAPLCAECSEQAPCATVLLADAYDVRRAARQASRRPRRRTRWWRTYLMNRSDNLALVSLNDTRPFRAYWPMTFVQLVGGRRWSLSICRYSTPGPLVVNPEGHRG